MCFFPTYVYRFPIELLKLWTVEEELSFYMRILIQSKTPAFPKEFPKSTLLIVIIKFVDLLQLVFKRHF